MMQGQGLQNSLAGRDDEEMESLGLGITSYLVGCIIALVRGNSGLSPATRGNLSLWGYR
jgi:hypothetical protein